jgi:hypothetical protein
MLLLVFLAYYSVHLMGQDCDCPIPQFEITPSDTTITCESADEFLAGLPELGYSNEATDTCADSGSVFPVITGSYDQCGGSLVVAWVYTDICGNTISASQQVTIEPAPAPAFRNIPADTVITVEEAETFVPKDIIVSNGEVGFCQINDTVAGVVTADFCNFKLFIQWDYSDVCGNTNSAQQIVSFDPQPYWLFLDPPADSTIDFESASTFMPSSLDFSNTMQNPLVTIATVNPSIVSDYDGSGGIITVEWDTTLMCGVNLNHVQIVTVLPLTSSTRGGVKGRVMMYPNPIAKGTMLDISPDDDMQYSIQIIDSAGRKVLEADHVPAVRAPAQAGLYLIALKDEFGRRYVSKIVVY